MKKTFFFTAFAGLLLLVGCSPKQQQEGTKPDSLQTSETVNISTPIPIDSLGLDIVRIANMLIAEKASGNIDNAPFIAYLDTLGFTKAEVNRHDWPINSHELRYELGSFNGEMECYEKELSGRFRHSLNEGKETSTMRILLVMGEANHIFAIDIKDNNYCWGNFIQLKDFGLHGPNNIGKGKGLIAEAGGDFLLIKYDTDND